MAEQAAQAPQALQQPGTRREQGGQPFSLPYSRPSLPPLYDDRLSVEFEGNDEGDQNTTDNLTAMAEHDHRIMRLLLQGFGLGDGTEGVLKFLYN
jgi:hypothetical protein